MSAPSKQERAKDARRSRSSDLLFEPKEVGSMSRQDKMKLRRRRHRRFFWLFAAAAVCALLFGEQVALLYVLSTLAMCGLLIVVAFSNLEARDAEMQVAAIRETADNISTNSTDLSRGARRAA
jgi:Flp pilus assembly protein TadB